jgi:poly(A) polymerase
MNFAENDCLKELLPEFVDTWKEIHPQAKGYTFDPEVNKMVPPVKKGRYDRVLLKSNEHELRISSMELAGTSEIKKNDERRPIFPSDHFGLIAHLELTTK